MLTKKSQIDEKPINIDRWTFVSGKLGGNDGGVFKDRHNKQYYCKFNDIEEGVVFHSKKCDNLFACKNEIMAVKFYELLGVAVPKLTLGYSKIRKNIVLCLVGVIILLEKT
jgi:hypothetical protein